jgi:hypothetical protein
LRVTLHTFPALALALSAAVVCHGASAGPTDKKNSTSLIGKDTAKAIGLTRPHDPRHAAGNLNAKNNGAFAHGSISSTVTPQSQGSKISTPGNLVRTSFGPQNQTSVPTASFALASPAGSLVSDHHGLRGTSTNAMLASIPGSPQTNHAAVRDAVISGTAVKHSSSMLVNIGGPTVAKTAAVINGTNIRAKQH